MKRELQHYIYKIHFLCGFPTGRYYIGKRTGNVNDSYAGSGNFCKAYYNKYGKIPGKTYIKEILEINPSKQINAEREYIAVGDLWKTDPLCMNQICGGMANEASGEQAKTAVCQYDINTGKLIKTWNSVQEAEVSLGINNISACCSGKRKRAGNWIWRYSSKGLKFVNPKEKYCSQARAVIQCDLTGKEIARFDRIQDAVIATGVDKKSIQECCIHRQHTGKGFIWKYVNEDYKRKCNTNLEKCGAKTVLQIDLNNKIINEHYSINEASRRTGIPAASIGIACRTEKKSHNYYWRYKNASRT